MDVSLQFTEWTTETVQFYLFTIETSEQILFYIFLVTESGKLPRCIQMGNSIAKFCRKWKIVYSRMKMKSLSEKKDTVFI